MSEEIHETTLALIGRVVYYFSNLEAMLFECTVGFAVSTYVEAILARENFSRLQEHFVTVLRERVRTARVPAEPHPEHLALIDEVREVMRTIDDVKERRNKLLHSRLGAYFEFDRMTLKIIEDPTTAKGTRRVRATSRARVLSKGYDVAIDKWTPEQLATLASDILAAMSELQAFHHRAVETLLGARKSRRKRKATATG